MERNSYAHARPHITHTQQYPQKTPCYALAGEQHGGKSKRSRLKRTATNFIIHVKINKNYDKFK